MTIGIGTYHTKPTTQRVTGRMKSLLIGLVLSALFFVNHGYCADINGHQSGIWSVESTEKQERWIVIHNLNEGLRSGIYHIEVLGLEKGAPAWQVKHLVNHMAITEKALQSSIRKPLKKGTVYPETFDEAYRKWLHQGGGKTGPVCDTSIAHCMENL
jgi:hypothetical protein